MTTLAFLDLETTHLSPAVGQLWEIGLIIREGDLWDVEYLWQVRPDLTGADPKALQIGRFHERFAVPDSWEAVCFEDGRPTFRLTLPELLFDLQDLLRDAVIVGSNPGFDVAFLTALLQRHGRKLPWHYRPIDVATLAAGSMYGALPFTGVDDPGPALPYRSYDLSEAMGVPRPNAEVGHTALGDARWAKAVYDAVTGRPS